MIFATNNALGNGCLPIACWLDLKTKLSMTRVIENFCNLDKLFQNAAVASMLSQACNPSDFYNRIQDQSKIEGLVPRKWTDQTLVTCFYIFLLRLHRSRSVSALTSYSSGLFPFLSCSFPEPIRIPQGHCSAIPWASLSWLSA